MVEPVVGGHVRKTGTLRFQAAAYRPEHLSELGPVQRFVGTETAILHAGEITLRKAVFHRAVIPLAGKDVRGDKHLAVELQVVGLPFIILVVTGAAQSDAAQGEALGGDLLQAQGLCAMLESLMVAAGQRLGGHDICLAVGQGDAGAVNDGGQDAFLVQRVPHGTAVAVHQLVGTVAVQVSQVVHYHADPL